MRGRLVLTSKNLIPDDIVDRVFLEARKFASQVEAPIRLSDIAIKIGVDCADSLPRDTFNWLNDAQIDLNFMREDQPKIKLFVADMDSTMIGQECIDELADYAGVKREIAEITEAAMQGHLDFEAALRARVALLRGLDIHILDLCYAERIIPNLGAYALLQRLGEAGVRRVLVSGGFTFFASKIAQRLGFDHYIANELEIVDGHLTGGLVGKIVDRAHKAEVLHAQCVELWIDPIAALAIGDGANDIDMINAAGVGVAYNAKAALEEQACVRMRHSRLDALCDIFEL